MRINLYATCSFFSFSFPLAKVNNFIFFAESGVPEIALDLVGRSRSEHAALQGENYSMSPKPVFQAHHDISVILTRPQVKFYDPIITVISLA